MNYKLEEKSQVEIPPVYDAVFINILCHMSRYVLYEFLNIAKYQWLVYSHQGGRVQLNKNLPCNKVMIPINVIPLVC